MTQSDTQAIKRELLYFPVVHTLEDMGTMGESVQKARVSRTGRSSTHRVALAVGKLWDEIERVASELQPLPGKMRAYQDGLPVCDHVREIVADLAAAGSRNHRLLLALEERGVVVMGTESPELLVEEYQLASAMISAGDSARVKAKGNTLHGSLLDRRDRFIADRINVTLLPGETGLLFIGMLHQVSRHLQADIKIQYPVGITGLRLE